MATAKKPVAAKKRSAAPRKAAAPKPHDNQTILWLMVVFTALCLTFAYTAYILYY